MKIRIGTTMAALAAVFMLSGCAETTLRTGEYRITRPDRDDFAVVYDDMIFLHIKSPDLAPGTLAYWEWAGKYKVLDNGEIELDMDRETRRRWKFYYQFLIKNNGMSFNDWAEHKGYLLQYQTPKLRNNVSGPRPAGSTGVDPVYQYQDLSNGRP